jgi:hypothetical protein
LIFAAYTNAYIGRGRKEADSAVEYTSGTEKLEQAVAAFREALKERTRERPNPR